MRNIRAVSRIFVNTSISLFSEILEVDAVPKIGEGIFILLSNDWKLV